MASMAEVFKGKRVIKTSSGSTVLQAQVSRTQPVGGIARQGPLLLDTTLDKGHLVRLRLIERAAARPDKVPERRESIRNGRYRLTGTGLLLPLLPELALLLAICFVLGQEIGKMTGIGVLRSLLLGSDIGGRLHPGKRGLRFSKPAFQFGLDGRVRLCFGSRTAHGLDSYIGTKQTLTGINRYADILNNRIALVSQADNSGFIPVEGIIPLFFLCRFL